MVKRRYTREEYEKTLNLHKNGVESPTKISKLLDIPVGAIRGWLYRGVKPRSAYSKEEYAEWYNKINTPENHEKQAKAMRGKKFSEEHKRKLALSKWGPKNPNWKGDKPKNPKGAGHLRAYRRFKPPKGKEIHHIDGNPMNNDPSNIEFLTRREHMIKDGRLEQFIKLNKK